MCRIALCAVVLTAVFCTQSPAEELNLSLKEAIRQAVANNLDLKAELYNPAQAEAELRKSGAIFEPHLLLGASYLDSSTYSAGTGGRFDLQTFKVSPGASQLLPLGGTLGLAFNNSYSHADPSSTVFGSYWQSDLTLTFNQPLLKNYGRETTELAIKVAGFGKEESLKQVQARVLALVASVRSEYFKLRSLRDDFGSRKTSLGLAKRILSETEARVRAGVLPAMEILNAQFGVSAREKDLIDAELAVRDQEEILRQLLQLTDRREIVPLDEPSRSMLMVNEEESIARALALRPDLDQLKTQLAASELQARVAKGRTQPDLNLSSSISFTGLGKGYGRDLERVAVADYPVWSLGLQFDYPLGNAAAENDYIKSRLKVDQLKTQIDSLRSSVVTEVRSSIRAIYSSFKQLEVTDRGRAYAEERLKSYLKKSEVGLATTKDVFDVENDLSTARTNQTRAQVLYVNAQGQLWKATGELLEREGVSISKNAGDELYRAVR